MSENEEREQRILDAAAHLFVHYGYDKTTVSDIARDSGVSKGAIYLHFESKEALLEGLIVRELKAYAEKWLALIEADPKGGTIAGMYKNSLYALTGSAFMTAMFTQDGRVLGNYLRRPDNFFRAFRDKQSHSERYLFVKLMQDAGAIRQELDPKV
ncbi:MAG TPA: helix-turn-helix domain-containing protein, partial [Symbiobacteriaceae bacterium]|nr:helix-turn-helix domain-containing protein [Symbiobacteriaceae bacterium]